MAAEITFSPAFVGDKWGGQSIGPVTIDGAQPTFPLARVRIEFTRNGLAGMTLDSDGSGDYLISIADADTWFFYLPTIEPIPLGAGIWKGIVRFYDTDSTSPKTLLYGDLIILK
jgi:hypothetical protein